MVATTNNAPIKVQQGLLAAFAPVQQAPAAAAEAAAPLPITTAAETPSEPPRGRLMGTPGGDPLGLVPWESRQAIYLDLLREAYDQLKAYNASFLKYPITRTLGHAWHEFLRPDRTQEPDQAHFLHGNMLHTLLLEPELYATRYVVEPADLPKRPTAKQLEEPSAKPGTKAHDAWRDAMAREAAWQVFEKSLPPGAQVVTAKDHDMVQAWGAAVRQHRKLGPLFAPEYRALNELTLVWIDPITKTACKARLDAVRVFDDHIWIGDLKTCHEAGDAFHRDAAKFLYVLSGTYYADALFHCKRALEDVLGLQQGALIARPIVLEFIAIEKTAPHFVQRIHLTNDQVEMGRRLIRHALDQSIAADEAGYWPAYSEDPVPLELPAYAWTWMESRLEVRG